MCCFGYLLLAATLLVSGCAKMKLAPVPSTASTTAAQDSPSPVRLSYSFSKGALGWEADFSDYSISRVNMELASGIRQLPPELKTDAKAFYVQGNNSRNYDLFMYLRRRLGPDEGVRPNQAYLIAYHLVFASNAGSNCLSVIGAPGESVFLKAGAAPWMPLAVVKDGTYRLNVDKGEVNLSGKHASLVGNIANGLRCKDFASPNQVPYVSLTRAHRHPVPIRANNKGELWLLVGTDSAHESVTALYYQQIDVELTPVGQDAAPHSN